MKFNFWEMAMKAKFILVFIGLSLISIPKAHAFEGTALKKILSLNLQEECFTAAVHNPIPSDGAVHYAAVSLRINNSNINPYQLAGGPYWARGYRGHSAVLDKHYPPITAAGIESGCGFYDVTILAQRGADAVSLTAQDYMGVRFTARLSASGELKEYEVALSGVTNTVIINTIPLISANSVAANTSKVTVEETKETVRNFLQNRSNHILNSQPSLIEKIVGQSNGAGGPLGLLQINGNEQSQKLFFSTSRSKILNAGKNHTSLNPSIASQALGNSEIDYYNAENTNILGFQRTNQTNNQTHNEASLNLEGNDGTDSTNLHNQSLAGSWDVWTEIYGSRSKIGKAESSLWVEYVGMHYFVSDQNIIGLIGQFDWSDQTDSSNNSKVDGRGWMVGPYIAGKFEDQTLYYEASIRYGRSENNISPIGTFTDKFETERLMLSGKLTGEYKHDTVIVRPEIGLTWYEETQKSYTDSLNNKIPEQLISTGELRFGPVFSKQVKLDNGNIITPNFGISGVYNFDVRNNNASKGTSTNTDELRARFTAGVKTTNQMGWSLSAASF